MMTIYFFTYRAARMSSFRRYKSVESPEFCRHKYSATCLAGNSVSQVYPKSLARWIASPGTRKNPMSNRYKKRWEKGGKVNNGSRDPPPIDITLINFPNSLEGFHFTFAESIKVKKS